MGDAPPPNPLRAPFPGPPSFYHEFTAENLANLAEFEEKQSSNKEAELPPELRNLRPPTPPADGKYNSFGDERSLDAPISTLPPDTRILPAPPSGEEDQKKPLIPSPSTLLTLTRSILLGYLEFIHILTTNPDATEYGTRWEDLRDLFRNVHALVNAYRGWQGRVALIGLLEQEIWRGRNSVQEWEAMEKQVEEVLSGLDAAAINAGADMKDQVESNDGKQHKKSDEQRMWDLINEEMGTPR